MGGRGKRGQRSQPQDAAQRGQPQDAAQCGEAQVPDPGLPCSDWANLPLHIVDLVAEKISLSGDYVRFSVVCKNWFSVAAENKTKSIALAGAPMLLIHQSGKCNDPWHVYDVLEDKVLTMKCHIPDHRYCGSALGWLIGVEADTSIILVKPLSRSGKTSLKENSIIHLPILEPPWEDSNPRRSSGDHYVLTATITADPLLNPDKCVIVLVLEFGMAFMSLADRENGKGWTYHYKKKDASVPTDDLLLAASDDDLLSLDLSTGSLLQVSAKIDGIDYQKKVYLVKLKDGTIVVVHRVMVNERGKSVTKSFRLFELTEDNYWIRKRSLGDEALFIGDNSSIVVTASHLNGCKPNSIYFVCDGDNSAKDWRTDLGIYSVYMNTISPFRISSDELVKKARRPPIWVLPTSQL